MDENLKDYFIRKHRFGRFPYLRIISRKLVIEKILDKSREIQMLKFTK